uniref:SFRICE_009573 n=1 Tax=Spodoptera frugiperda TaxID=7108 RepID=A0A2H1VYB1_SPOFR
MRCIVFQAQSPRCGYCTVPATVYCVLSTAGPRPPNTRQLILTYESFSKTYSKPVVGGVQLLNKAADKKGSEQILGSSKSKIIQQPNLVNVRAWWRRRGARGAGRRVASDSRGGFRGRGQRPRPPRRRARQCQGRCSRGQLTSGDARGTRRRPRAAVDSRPAAETHALRHTRAINRSRRRQRALLRRRAVLTSQVPEVARAAAATAPASRASPVAQPPHAHCTSSGALVMMVPGACWSTLTVSAVVIGRVGCVDTWCGARGQGEEVSSRAARRQRLR